MYAKGPAADASPVQWKTIQEHWRRFGHETGIQSHLGFQEVSQMTTKNVVGK